MTDDGGLMMSLFWKQTQTVTRHLNETVTNRHMTRQRNGHKLQIKTVTSHYSETVTNRHKAVLEPSHAVSAKPSHERDRVG